MLSQYRVWSQVCTCITLVHGSANHLFELLHKVRWAVYPERSTVEHVGVDHCGAHVLVAQKFLDGADVLPALKKVRRKRVAEGVAAGRFAHPGVSHGPLHGLLHHARIKVVAPLGT